MQGFVSSEIPNLSIMTIASRLQAQDPLPEMCQNRLHHWWPTQVPVELLQWFDGDPHGEADQRQHEFSAGPNLHIRQDCSFHWLNRPPRLGQTFAPGRAIRFGNLGYTGLSRRASILKLGVRLDGGEARHTRSMSMSDQAQDKGENLPSNLALTPDLTISLGAR